MRKFLSVVVLLCVLASSALAFETDGKNIIVDVTSTGENRLAAIESGLVEALRLASGSFIDSKTELNNEELTERIISYSRGSISKYDVMSEDTSKASEGLYTVKLRVWVESELLRDGVQVAANKTSRVKFSPEDLAPEKPAVNPVEAQNNDKLSAANKNNASSGVEALSAMLERYNPEDFINIKVVGKVTKVKGKETEDLCQVLVEVSFNDELYNQKFIPDLKQVLDTIAAKKKDITLTRERNILRSISSKKGAPMSDNSVILSGSNLGKEYNLAVFDKPDRFGCRLYGFKKDDSDKILNNLTGALAQFRGRIARLKGFEIELLDENGDIVSTAEQKITLPYLLTDSVVRNNVWAFHPSIMNYMGMYNYIPLYIENKAINLPLRFELPAEFQEITREINAKLVFDDDYSDSALKTRNALHNAAMNALTKQPNRADFESALEIEYPLAQSAIYNIETNQILNTQGILRDEVVDRLADFREKGSHAAFYGTFLILEADNKDFEAQKRSVQYLTQAAMIHPDAMIRMGEVQEQGFYGVKKNSKRADFYYKEGIRILSLLASQGLPSAAVSLGHVYIEGLGTKQDIPRAEKFYKFVEKSSYNDPEYWLWIHYGVTLRQVVPPEKILEQLRQWNDYKDARTCLYLVREKIYSHSWNVRGDLINVPARYFANILNGQKYHLVFETIYINGDNINTSYKEFDFKK